jgi:hypothetical protein
MSVFPRRVCVVAAACLAFLVAGSRNADALVLDWNAVTWSPGALINSYDLTGDAVNDITVTVTSQQANIWQLDPTSGIQTPTVNQTLTGGLLPAENSLMLAANLHTNSNATFQLSFTGVYPGAANVSFTLFDIDLSADRDIISNIYGVLSDGSHVAATITNLGSTVTLTGSGLTQTLTGNVPSPNNSGNGNATISFGSAVIYDVFFTFGNSSGPPRYQDIGIGDISFSPVPEINPAAASAISCLLVAGLMAFVHRRAKLKARRVQTIQD